MSDYLADTPRIGRDFCSVCEPDADPFTEVLHECRCHLHAPPVTGSADDAVRSDHYLSGTDEAGGETNAALCRLIHRPEDPCPAG